MRIADAVKVYGLKTNAITDVFRKAGKDTNGISLVKEMVKNPAEASNVLNYYYREGTKTLYVHEGVVRHYRFRKTLDDGRTLDLYLSSVVPNPLDAKNSRLEIHVSPSDSNQTGLTLEYWMEKGDMKAIGREGSYFIRQYIGPNAWSHYSIPNEIEKSYGLEDKMTLINNGADNKYHVDNQRELSPRDVAKLMESIEQLKIETLEVLRGKSNRITTTFRA